MRTGNSRTAERGRCDVLSTCGWEVGRRPGKILRGKPQKTEFLFSSRATALEIVVKLHLSEVQYFKRQSVEFLNTASHKLVDVGFSEEGHGSGWFTYTE